MPAARCLAAQSRVAERWRELTQALPTSSAAVERELETILAAYAEPNRHYHDIAHIAAMLELSSRRRADLEDAVAFDLAIVYHDIVYDRASKDNEEESARRAASALPSLGCGADLTARVATLVAATAHLSAAPIAPQRAADADLDLLLDIDLAILASPPAEYDLYAAAIRHEYAIYPDAAYARGRAAALRALLALDPLYRTPDLQQAWQPAARANLTRELAALQP